MDITGKKSKKEIAIFAAIAIISVSALGGAIFYYFQNTSSQTSPTITPSQSAADSVARPNSTQNQPQYSILNQPSPFAPQPVPGSPSSSNGTSPGIPEMPPMPPITPILSPDNASLPGSTPPFDGNKIQVTGIVIGAVKTAVLSNGQSQITVKEGSECQWGMVTSINKNGIVLNGQYIAMNRLVNKK